MSTVIFYEKPGCGNNTHQKQLLAAAGHEVIARNLLSKPWTAARLRAFFGDLAVAAWFNRAAPRVKSGEVVPEALGAETALEMMLADPLLIRRPLMQVGEEYRVGFDAEAVDVWIGLQGGRAPRARDLEACPRSHAATPCAEAKQESC